MTVSFVILTIVGGLKLTTLGGQIPMLRYLIVFSIVAFMAIL